MKHAPLNQCLRITIQAHEIFLISTGITGLVDMVKKALLALSHVIWIKSRGPPRPQSQNFSDENFGAKTTQNGKLSKKFFCLLSGTVEMKCLIHLLLQKKPHAISWPSLCFTFM